MKKLAIALAGLALFAPAAVAKGTDTARTSVIGGALAAPGDFPSMAFILATDETGKGFSCSGTVVSPNVVLTAGHCVQDLSTGKITPASEYKVVTGATDVTDSSTRQLSDVSQAIVYPRFSRTTVQGDAGLLILSTPTTAPAIPLATAADRSLYRERTPITIAGWGLTAGSAKDAPTALRWGITYVQSHRYCARQVAFYYPFFAASSQLCAIEPPHFSVGTCHGDSGGPTLARRPDNTAVEIGITSLVGDNCTPRLPDVFTRVDRVSPWVNGWIEATKPGSTTPPPPTPAPLALHLPSMTKNQAKAYVTLALEHDFKNVFRHGRGYTIECERLAAQRMRCGVAWFRRPKIYAGVVTVFYVFRRDAISLNARYVMRSINARCYLSDRRESCKVHVRRG
jgi:secreted trypsin-like serine protease